MSKVIFIVGPTALGKSIIAFQLAKKLNAEIVSCDSMLVYKEPNIITSKPINYLKEIPHHFVNIISVEETYSVFDYFSSATKLIQEKLEQKKVVVVCGGSGLYIKSILDGIFKEGPKDVNLRKKLEEKAHIYGKDYLHQELKKIDPETASRVNDLRRIIRALEVYYLTGLPLSEKKKEAKGLWGSFAISIFGLTLNRNLLYSKIDSRVDEMFKKGVVLEVKNLLKLNLSPTAKEIIGIKEIAGYLEGKYDLNFAKEILKKNTHHLAKRQMTWFKKDGRISWINIENFDSEYIVNLIIKTIE